MTKPAFQRRHYEAIAATIKGRDLDGLTLSSSVAYSMASEFANRFANDNSNFDRSRFLKACGLEP
jgi:hypothetical protein